MIDYIIGYVREVNLNSIVVECSDIGYHITVANPTGFNRDELTKIYTYLQVKEDAFVLYGFKNRDEKRMFLKLIEVAGLGPKTVIGMFANITVQQLVQAIETSNTAFLKKLPGIGPKAAQQIILDLKGKLVLDPDQGSVATAKINPQLQEARDALKSLGFKASEIDNVLSKISVVEASTEEYLKQALKMLGKQKSY